MVNIFDQNIILEQIRDERSEIYENSGIVAKNCFAQELLVSGIVLIQKVKFLLRLSYDINVRLFELSYRKIRVFEPITIIREHLSSIVIVSFSLGVLTLDVFQQEDEIVLVSLSMTDSFEERVDCICPYCEVGGGLKKTKQILMRLFGCVPQFKRSEGPLRNDLFGLLAFDFGLRFAHLFKLLLFLMKRNG